MEEKIPIIGIGASAGGLEPLEELFSKMPENTGFAFVVIQHLAPNHKSLMDELLSRHTSIPIKIISHGLEIFPNHIYLNPPKEVVELVNGRFILSEKTENRLSFPISTFFASLAENSQMMAAAIVLSGTGSDGAEGIKYIKEKGGLVLSQEPGKAIFDGMPNNAILTGSVDKVLQVSDMADELIRFFKGAKAFHESDDNFIKKKLVQILLQVKLHAGIDFTGYKFSTVQRRILRRLSITGIHTMEEYQTFITDSQTEARLLAKELLIGVTRFFRDKDAFEAIRQTVIPKIIEQNKKSREIRIWVPACSTGEEAYSLAILFKDYLRTHKLQYNVTIFATDLDKDAIKKASKRTFTESIANEIPPEFLNNYFTQQKGGFQILKEIREMIVFSNQNLIQDPPFSKIDLLSCRNFLIYLTPEIQQKVFALFQFALKKEGFLFLGMSESVGEMGPYFEEFDNKNKVYINRTLKKPISLSRTTRPHADHIFNSESDNKISYISNDSYSLNPNVNIYQEIQKGLIQSYVPDALIFNREFELLHTTGKVSDWLKIPIGEVSNNILKMIPDNLVMSVELMANEVLEKNNSVFLNIETIEPRMQTIYGNGSLKIRISPFQISYGDTLLMATFLPNQESTKSKSKQIQIDLNLASQEKIRILERALRVNEENLQTTIEELESSNEELQAANEELQSSNEELESVNEELFTMNTEFQEKVHELTDSTNDLVNLIQSTDIAILFLDENLHIRRYTPALNKILQLMPQDIGRHISHFRAKIQLEDLMVHLEKVLEHRFPFESTIKDLQEDEYILRITPFKTEKNETKGIVLSFVDITAIARTQTALKQSKKELSQMTHKYNHESELFELITHNSRDMISLINRQGFPEYSSPSSFEITGYTPGEFLKYNFQDHIADSNQKIQWQEVKDNLKQGSFSSLILYKFKIKSGQEHWFESTLQKITDGRGKEDKILIITRDVHQRVLLNEELKSLSMIVNQTNNAIIITNKAGLITFVNDAFESMSGFKEEDILGKKPASFLQGAESDPATIEIMSNAIKDVQPFNVDIINYNAAGNKHWVNIQSEPMYNSNGEHTGFFSIQADISSKKDYESQISKLNSYLNVQNIKLEQINQSLDEFAHVVSHDIKAPARNIKNMLELILKKENSLSPDIKKEYFQVAVDAATELGQLVNNMLEYSRSGRIEEEMQTKNLEEICKETITVYQNEIDKINGKIKLSLNPTEVRVYPILFKRLLGNLLNNAIKYRSDRKLEVSITSYPQNGKVKFEISDNGIGIAADRQKEIFKIFNRIEKRSDNNGIGLSVCKKIAEIHGGEIWVDSELGKGSTFQFEIINQL